MSDGVGRRSKIFRRTSTCDVTTARLRDGKTAGSNGKQTEDNLKRPTTNESTGTSAFCPLVALFPSRLRDQWSRPPWPWRPSLTAECRWTADRCIACHRHTPDSPCMPVTRNCEDEASQYYSPLWSKLVDTKFSSDVPNATLATAHVDGHQLSSACSGRVALPHGQVKPRYLSDFMLSPCTRSCEYE